MTVVGADWEGRVVQQHTFTIDRNRCKIYTIVAATNVGERSDMNVKIARFYIRSSLMSFIIDFFELDFQAS